MSEELLTVPGYAPAALVVEFNLLPFFRGESQINNQQRGESDAQYHARLSVTCNVIDVGGRGYGYLHDRALAWSDHYRRWYAEQRRGASA